MRILFFISVLGHGSGGHFHSLNHISREIGEKEEVQIISVGPGRSTIIEENPYFRKQIFFNGRNIVKLVSEVRGIVNEFNPEILHFFDSNIYNVLRIPFSSSKYKIILNKCGGPNNRIFPYVGNLILFSNENLEWFKNKSKFKHTNTYLIPNRVHSIILDKSFEPIIKDKNSFTFVRICRIGLDYLKSIEDSIDLVKYLYKNENKSVQLFIIGVIENQNVYEELLKKIEHYDFIKLLTDQIYTREASRMLYLADAVIATGRGLMESASLGIPLLTLNSIDNYPVLINKENFKEIFYTNFSQRSCIKNFNSVDNLNSIKKLTQDKNYNNQHSEFSFYVYNKYFNIERVHSLYVNTYKKILNTPNKFFADLPIILKSYYYYYLNSRKI